jgi:hypothetical protein
MAGRDHRLCQRPALHQPDAVQVSVDSHVLSLASSAKA